MNDTPAFFRTQVSDNILHVELFRPERLNALHAPAHAQLAKVFDEFELDPALRVAIISGNGRAFCAGNDLKWQADGGSLERPVSGFAGLTLRHQRTKPIIAAVHGEAFGGGCEIVLAADLAIAAESARLALPEVRVGLVPLAGVHLLPRRVGLKNALWMLLTGQVMSAEGALRIGLVNEVVAVEDLIPRAWEIARTIIKASPEAIAACMTMVRESLAENDISKAMTAPSEALARLRASDDFVEGPKAFAEGRIPNWKV